MVALKWIIAFAVVGCFAIAEVQGRRGSSSSDSSDSSERRPRHRNPRRPERSHGHDRPGPPGRLVPPGRPDRPGRPGRNDRNDRRDRNEPNNRFDWRGRPDGGQILPPGWRNEQPDWRQLPNWRNEQPDWRQLPSWKPDFPSNQVVPETPRKNVQPPPTNIEIEVLPALPPRNEARSPESLTPKVTSRSKENDSSSSESSELPGRVKRESWSNENLIPKLPSRRRENGLSSSESSDSDSSSSESLESRQPPKIVDVVLPPKSNWTDIEEIDPVILAKREAERILAAQRAVCKKLLEDGGMNIPVAEVNEKETKTTLRFKVAGLKNNLWLKDISGFRGGNDGFQYYSGNPKVSYVKNGKLVISPQKTEDLVWAHEHNRPYNPLKDAYSEKECNMEPCLHKVQGDGGLPFLSARIKTSGTINLTRPGTLVISAKMPRGDFLWPIIQLLPANDTYGNWPASGAITLAQTRGNLDYKEVNKAQVGNSVLESVVFFGGPSCSKMVHNFKNIDRNGSRLSDGFHVYNYTWDNQFNLEMSLDGEKFGKVNLRQAVQDEKNKDPCVKATYEGKPDTAPFDHEFRLALMVSVGGRGAFRDYMMNKDKLQKDIFSYNGDKPTPTTQFWKARDSWEPTWKNEKGEPTSALEVDHIGLYYKDKSKSELLEDILGALENKN